MRYIQQCSLIISVLLSCSFSLQAAWFTGSGSAELIPGNMDKSRDKAISNALLTVVHQAGTSVETHQVVESGLLTVDEIVVRSNGEIHDMRLLSEKVIAGIIHVTIEADLYPFSSCPQEKYAKPIFVGPFHLESRQHAQLGGIYESDEAISQRLYYQLKRQSSKIDPRYVMTQQIAFTRDSHYNNELQILDIAPQIASKYNVQYVLFGTIEDMSDFYETTNYLLIKNTVHKRHFQMNVFLVDAINNTTIFQKNYAATSEWPYKMTHRFDVKGAEFWQTDYGKIIDENINKVVKDIQKSLYCKPTMATIISQYNDQVIMNIGHNNDVEKGDKFQLIRSQYQPQGTIFIPDDILLTVVSVQANRAILKTIDPTDMNNIQIRDMLTPVDEYTLQRLAEKYETQQSTDKGEW